MAIDINASVHPEVNENKYQIKFEASTDASKIFDENGEVEVSISTKYEEPCVEEILLVETIIRAMVQRFLPYVKAEHRWEYVNDVLEEMRHNMFSINESIEAEEYSQNIASHFDVATEDGKKLTLEVPEDIESAIKNLQV